MLTSFKFIFYTELILVWRRSQEWLYPLGFFILVMSLFPLAFTPDPVFLQKYMPGCAWIAALLASLLSVENIFYADLEEGHLEQVILSPLPLSFIMLTKLAAHWLASCFPLILLTPAFSLFFHLSLSCAFTLACSLLLGTPIFILTGSLAAALTLGLRQQGILLGLLVLPLLVPVLIFGVSITQQFQSGLPITGPLAFLASLFVLSVTLLPWTIAAALRIGMED